MSAICDDLRVAILQAAMRGKLTKQLPEDGNAKDLLEEIKAEKEKLISEGKIKKQKPLAPITDDEIPFSIPKNWNWVRLGDFSINIFSGKSPKYNKTENGLYILGQKNNQESGINLNGLKYSTQDFWNTIDEWQFLKVNDVLLNTLGGGTVGRSGIFDLTDGKYVTDGHLFVFRSFNPTSAKFLLFFLKSIKSEIEKNADGSTNQVFLKLGQVNNWVIPLPPLTEQKRIVEKVDELMTRVADLEQSADALASLKKAFPDDIKASLLQAAMQGKLTKQLPEDGSAEGLLEEIKAEKEKLIAEGKIKKQKPLAPIADDEIPFSIPDNWKWVRLRDTCTKIADGDHNPPKGLTHESEYLMLSSQNINNDTLVNMSKVRYLDKNTFEKVNERTNLQKEDILFTSVGSLGRSCIFREDINACFQRSVSVLTTLVYNEYLKLFLDSPFIQNKVYKEATGTAQKGFYLNQLEKCPIAIPPLSEQKRIVERLNALMQNINVVGELIEAS